MRKKHRLTKLKANQILLNVNSTVEHQGSLDCVGNDVKTAMFHEAIVVKTEVFDPLIEFQEIDSVQDFKNEIKYEQNDVGCHQYTTHEFQPQRHLQSNTEEHICPKCNRQFDEKYRLSQHMRNAHRMTKSQVFKYHEGISQSTNYEKERQFVLKSIEKESSENPSYLKSRQTFYTNKMKKSEESSKKKEIQTSNE